MDNDEVAGKNFLGHYSTLALFLFISIVIVSEFWFMTFLETFEELIGTRPRYWQLLLLSIALTFLVYYLAVKIFQIPIASLF